MADFVVYAADPSQVEVRAGQPPVDQSALVAQLQAQVAALEAKISAAAIEAQQTVDALA